MNRDYSDADGYKAMVARKLTTLELSRNDMVKSLDIALDMDLEQYKETILYISSGFIQLAALPLIRVGQDIMGRSAEIRSQEDHEMIKEQYRNIQEMLEEIKKLHHHTHEMLGTKDDD